MLDKLAAALEFFGHEEYRDEELPRVKDMTRRVLVMSMQGDAADLIANEADGLAALAGADDHALMVALKLGEQRNHPTSDAGSLAPPER